MLNFLPVGFPADYSVKADGSDLIYKNSEMNFDVGGEGSISTEEEGMTSLTEANVGSYFECNINVAASGIYEIIVNTRKDSDGGIFQLSIDGENQGDPQDLYSDSQGDQVKISLGNKSFDTPGIKRFRFTVTGKKDNSGDYNLYFYDMTLKFNGTAVPSPSPADSQSDQKEENYDKAISTLVSMGIIKNSQDSNFQPENNVTRAELADLIAKMLGLESSMGNSGLSSAFQDVFDNYWAAGSIAIVSSMGIINGYGDGRFAPDDPVTYEQAVKALVCALGYGIYAEQKGGYPWGYLVLASEKGITRNALDQIGKNVKWKALAQMAYNALDVEVLEPTGFGEETKYSSYNGNTLMKKRLDTQKEEGIVTATGETGLIGESSLKEDEVEIDGVIYKTGNTNAKDYLGYRVTFYAKENDDKDKKTLLFIEADDTENQIITVKADDIDNVIEIGQKKIELEYWTDKDKNEEPKKATISGQADIIYNGKAYPLYTISDLKPDVGEVILIDNNGDNEYDVVRVTSYQTYIVDGISITTNTISDKRGKPALILDPQDSSYIFYITKNGKAIGLADIKPWNVLSVAISRDNGNKSVKDIVVSEEKVTGQVEEVDDDKVVIGGKEYKKVPDCTDEIKLDDGGDFYLNHEGKIAAYDSRSSGKKYAFLVKGAVGTGVDKSPEFKLFTQEGKMIVYKVAEKVTLDGRKVNSSDLLNTSADLFPDVAVQNTLFKNGTNTFLPQLIGYDLNSDNEISSIDTSTVIPGEDEDTLYSSKGMYSRAYSDNGRIFNSSHDAISLEQNVKVFVIPSVTEPNVSNSWLAKTEKDDEKHYAVKTSSMFSNATYYNVQPYNESVVLTTRLLVNYQTDDTVSWDNAELVLVDKVTESCNEEGENVQKIYGLKSNGTKVTLTCNSETAIDPNNNIDPNTVKSVSDIGHGDVIQVTVDMDNNVNNIRVDYCAKESNPYVSSLGNYGKSVVNYVKIIGKDGGFILVSPATVSETSPVKPRLAATAKVMMYNKINNGKISMATLADVKAGQSAVMRNYDSRIMELVVINE